MQKNCSNIVMHEQYQFCPWCYEDMSMVLWRYVPGVTRSKKYTPISLLNYMLHVNDDVWKNFLHRLKSNILFCILLNKYRLIVVFFSWIKCLHSWRCPCCYFCHLWCYLLSMVLPHVNCFVVEFHLSCIMKQTSFHNCILFHFI
jgi:hypothetical protein